MLVQPVPHRNPLPERLKQSTLPHVDTCREQIQVLVSVMDVEVRILSPAFTYLLVPRDFRPFAVSPFFVAGPPVTHFRGTRVTQ